MLCVVTGVAHVWSCYIRLNVRYDFETRLVSPVRAPAVWGLVPTAVRSARPPGRPARGVRVQAVSEETSRKNSVHVFFPLCGMRLSQSAFLILIFILIARAAGWLHAW